MRRSWLKFAFIECGFQVTNSFEYELECECRFNGLKAIKRQFFALNKPKTHCIALTAFVGNSALLP